MTSADPFFRETLPHLSQLRAVARRLAHGRRDVAEDLVQETYLHAIAARERYRPDSNARAWLHRILTNAARSARRRDLRDARLVERYLRSGEADGDDAGSHDGARLVGRGVDRALAALPEAYRAVVALVDMEGLGYREAADRMHAPVGTVMSRLHRARRQLRRSLAPPPPAAA